MAQEDYEQEASDRAVVTNILRNQNNPPDEAYEAAWRDALKMLEDAGPKPGFLLLIADRDPLDENYVDTKFALSTGRDRVGATDMVLLIADWLAELAQSQ